MNGVLVQAKEAEGLEMAEGSNVTEQLSQLDADEDDMLKVSATQAESLPCMRGWCRGPDCIVRSRV